MDRQVVVGRFRLKGLIDRGNMGEAHRAEEAAALGEAREQDALKRILRRRPGGAGRSRRDLRQALPAQIAVRELFLKVRS